jgi:hypothetical protein
VADDCGCGSTARIADLKELLMLRIAGIESVATERFAAIDRALVLRAAELDAHLRSLNGEAERLRSMQATYVPRELYEQRLREVDAVLTGLRESRATEMGRQSIVSTLLAAAVSVLIALAAHFAFKAL